MISKMIYALLVFISWATWVFLIYSSIIFTWLFLLIIPSSIVYYFLYKRKSWKIILPIIALLIIIITPFMMLVELISMSFNPVSSTWRYKSILRDIWDSQYTEHFPESINIFSRNVKFSFAPQFLQWWGHFVLKQKLDSSKLKEKFLIHDNNYEDIPDHLNPNISVIEENISNYKVIFIYAQPYQKDNWNHGRTSWVAFWKYDTSIIYWYEFW